MSRARTTGGSTLGLSPSVVADGTWHQTGMSYDSLVGNINTIVDGAIVDSTVSLGGTLASSAGFAITFGNNGDFGVLKAMDIAGVAIFGRALTPAELATLYAARLTGP